jgi:hypothetical protein
MWYKNTKPHLPSQVINFFKIKIRLCHHGFSRLIGISWISKLQKVVALSTTEAEYVAAIEASKYMIWLQSFMEELGKKQENSRLYCDNESAIHLAKKSAFHSNTKDIQLRYHFIRSTLEDGHLKLEKIHTSHNPADMLTKGVTREKLSSCLVSVDLQE